MRFAFRSSLKPTYRGRSLGYRCVYDINKNKASFLSEGSLYGFNAKWVTSTGEKIDSKDLAGKIRLISMVYTRCKTVCPLVTSYIKRLEGELPAELRNRIRFTLISLDTENDKAADLKEFKNKYHLNDKWDLLVGDNPSTRWVAHKLELAYKEQFDGNFAHSGVISVVDESGKLLTQINPSHLSAAKIRKLFQ